MFERPFANPRLQSNQHSFARVPQANIPRSSFNRSHGYKTTFDAGYIIPVYADEALPGDTFSMKMTSFARLATPIAPLMDNIYLDVHFFAVPIRLLWNNWERFNGAQDDPTDSTDFTVPVMTVPAGGPEIGSLSDYLGWPTDIAAGYTAVSLWHRAYNRIWNEWYRDENLQDSLVVDLDDGPDTLTDYVLKKRNKRHDYFTSCLPWPQKVDPAVSIPLGTTAPVILNPTTGIYPVIRSAATHSISGSQQDLHSAPTTGALEYLSGTDAVLDPNETLLTDLSDATAATINELREAFQMQKLFERDARGGTRYTEIIRAHFGVVSPDARLQRSEYLGGGTTMVNVSPVPQTSSTDATTPQGNLAAMGTASHFGVGFTKSFTEHCVLLGLISARADLNYQEGLNRMFKRSTRYDFYWPALSHIGEQAVLNQEIYFQGTGDDTNVFGYQERYAEYRYKPNVITGEFRSAAAGSLDVWHLAQDFSSLPTLGNTFIQEDPPIDRVIAVPSAPHFLFDASYQLLCARPMPVYSVPGLIDHF